MTLTDSRLASLRAMGAQCTENNPIITGKTLVALVDEVAALRAERDTLRATVAGLREAAQAFMAANDDYLHQFLNPDGSEVRWQAMAKAQDDLRTALAVPPATPATPAPDGRRDAGEGGE